MTQEKVNTEENTETRTVTIEKEVAPKKTAPKKTAPKKTAPKKTAPKKTALKKTAPIENVQIKEKPVFATIKPPAIPVYEKSIESHPKKPTRPPAIPVYEKSIESHPKKPTRPPAIPVYEKSIESHPKKPTRPPAIPVYEKSIESHPKKPTRSAHHNNRRKKPHNQTNEKSDSPQPTHISAPKIIHEPVENPTISYIADLQNMKIDALIKYATNLGLQQITSLPRSQIVFEIVKLKSQDRAEQQIADGILETLPDGYGFLRSPIYSYAPSAEDIYISHNLIRRSGLKTGDRIVGPIRLPEKKERYFALQKVTKVNGFEPDKQNRKAFENLTPLFPEERFIMETTPTNYSARILDLTAPIGKGQRGLIVAPPKTGKTMLMQNIAHSITANSPEAELIVLMIDERPEEVTDMKKVIKGEVVSSTFDEPPERHVQVAEMIIEKAKRMVEQGQDVVILLDSLTRLARAYNTIQPHSGKILTGGIDASSLHKPKRFFGAARNIEGEGSLTIIATALIDTGSKMDEVIYEEFKGTGNMELVLDRQLSDRRVFPSIDVIKSGTRKEELLYHEQELEKITLLQKAISDLSPLDAMKIMLSRIKKVKTNAEFLLSIKE